MTYIIYIILIGVNLAIGGWLNLIAAGFILGLALSPLIEDIDNED